jgi:hypothetical protein
VQGARELLRLSGIASGASAGFEDAPVQKEMLRKMLLAMAADLRIVLLRLASRLQTLRWHASAKVPCRPIFNSVSSRDALQGFVVHVAFGFLDREKIWTSHRLDSNAKPGFFIVTLAATRLSAVWDLPSMDHLARNAWDNVA